MVNGPDRKAALVYSCGCINLNTIYHTVHTAVQDDSLHIGKCLQLLFADVVGMNLGVNTHCSDLTGQTRILITAQIEN